MSILFNNIQLLHQDTGASFVVSAQRTATAPGFSVQSIEVGSTDETVDTSEFLSPRHVMLRLMSGDDVQVGLDGSTYPFRLSGANDFSIFRLDVEGIRETSTITAGADTAGSLAGDYLDLTDRNGTVRVWFADDGVAATGTITYGVPGAGDGVTVAGFSFFEAVDFTSIETLTAAIDALTNVSATDDGTTITIVASTKGTAGNALDLALDVANTGTMAAASGGVAIPPGAAGSLAGGVDPATAPATPAGGRLLQVDYLRGDTAGTIAAAIQAVLDADEEFSATVSEALVTVTDAHVGARTDISAGTTGWTVATTQQGAASQAIHLKSAGTSQVLVGVIPD